jgi:hypothetical protein
MTIQNDHSRAMHFPRSGAAWRSVVLVGIAVACAAGVHHVFDRLGGGPAGRELLQLTGLNHASVRDLHNLHFDPADRTVQASGKRPSFVLVGPSARQGIHAVTLRLQPRTPLEENQFIAFRLLPTPDGGMFEDKRSNHYYATRGSPAPDDYGLVIRWCFPETTQACRIECPESTSFELIGIEVVTGPVEPPAGTRYGLLRCGRVVAGGVLLWIVVLGVQLAWPATRPRQETTRGWIVTGFVATCGLSAVLLPPFQGPDEWIHWKNALTLFRPDAAGETALFNLPEATRAQLLPFKSENQFDTRLLGAQPAEAGTPRQRWYVNYPTPLTYPFVGLVNLCFPRVQTTSEALLFFYLCRALPALVFVALLYAANRASLLSWTAILFFSSPLVQQQFTVVTADTIPNLGTLAVLLLFAACRKQPRLGLHVALWVVTLFVVLAKPPICAGLLLLPAALVPYQKIPHRRLLLPLAGTVVLVTAWWLGQRGFTLLGGKDQSSPAARQLARLLSGEGRTEFLQAWRNLIAESSGVTDWFGPLGWLDTYFTQRHASLIYLSVWLAWALDLFVYGPWLVREMLKKPQRALATLACIAAIGLFLHFSICFIMYLTETQPNCRVIVGVQFRYLFPALMIALLLPLAVFGSPPVLSGRSRWVRLLVGSAAASLLPWLLFAREVELTTTLLTRYW